MQHDKSVGEQSSSGNIRDIDIGYDDRFHLFDLVQLAYERNYM